MQTPEAFVVAWNPVPTASRVALASRRFRASLWRCLASPAIVLAVWFITGRTWARSTLVTWLVVSVLLSLAWVAWYAVRLRTARRSLARVPSGEAMRVDHWAITGHTPGAASQTIPWDVVTRIRAEGPSHGDGPRLVVHHTGGEWSAPLSFLDALPGTIDSALRAYSGGRRGLDLSGLDQVW